MSRSNMSYGAVFSRLTVYKLLPNSKTFCICLCGSELVVSRTHLQSGHTKSCGCIQRRAVHAQDRPEYVAWKNIIQRCENPNNSHYSGYGGRGITICNRWRNSFALFLLDMGPRPSDDEIKGVYSIDRIDNNKGYEPGNCRWITKQDNGRRSKGRLAYSYT